MRKFISVLFVLALLGGIALYVKEKSTDGYNFDTKVSIKDVSLKAAIVDTQEERTVGLSNHRALRSDEALLFVFDRADFYGIWMKDMKFPIDVIWFDENMKIVSIKENFSPSSYPEVAYPSSKALFILETKAGFVEDHKILIGDELKIFK